MALVTDGQDFNHTGGLVNIRVAGGALIVRRAGMEILKYSHTEGDYLFRAETDLKAGPYTLHFEGAPTVYIW